MTLRPDKFLLRFSERKSVDVIGVSILFLTVNIVSPSKLGRNAVSHELANTENFGSNRRAVTPTTIDYILNRLKAQSNH